MRTQASAMLLCMGKWKPRVNSERFSSVLSVENSQMLFHVRDAKLQDGTSCPSPEATWLPSACSITQKEGVCWCVFPVECFPPQHCLLIDLSLSSSSVLRLWRGWVSDSAACAAETTVINSMLV